MDNFDLKKYLAEGKLFKENTEQGYTLYSTNVEYDNGKTGYMYQLLNSEDREENEIGFDQLYFDDEGNRLEMGVDFKDFDQGSYQEEEVSAEEAMKMYKSLTENKMKDFDLKKYLAEGRLFKEDSGEEVKEIFGFGKKKPKLYEPKVRMGDYVFSGWKRDIESKVKAGEMPPNQLSGINSVMMAIEEFLKNEILSNEDRSIKFTIFPTGQTGGLTDDKLKLYISVDQKGKWDGNVNPIETLKVLSTFIDDYLKKQEGISVGNEIVERRYGVTAYGVTIPITFKENETVK
tara:strand:- start:984 stop:1850 length:867 start_codon:yes stop_codon:yes gene_type:complete